MQYFKDEKSIEATIQKRVEFIRNAVKSAGVNGIVFGNSGGKDCALVGILCKMACKNTIGVIMPCKSIRNYEADKTDAETVAEKFDIETRTVDLSKTRDEISEAVQKTTQVSPAALSNIAPRLRMTTLYAIAASENLLVAGTSNKSERYMGYFTKWGDGGCDFNPIADLTVGEVYELLRFLGAPEQIIEKAPSAGLFDGQTDETEMGISYANIDNFLLTGEANEKDLTIIQRYHKTSEHKRILPLFFE
ncbi:MAG: NAD(+) synthase [Chitinivibrionia bacterium]|nr:NAD(+) synthase [Chitinivibrionia bacterium]